jgi:hypothetical protein
MPYKDPARAREQSRKAGLKFRAKRKARNKELGRKLGWKSVKQYASPRQKVAWITTQTAWELAEPGSAQLEDMAFKAREAGLYCKKSSIKAIEISLYWYIRRQIEGRYLNI